MESSLQEGFDLSWAVLAAQILDNGHFLLLASDEFKRNSLDLASGGVTRTNLAEEALGRFLDEIYCRGPMCVVVEDDLRVTSDPIVGRKAEPLAPIGNHVLHWCELRHGGKACARVISTGSSGYPLNAFVSSSTAAKLSLVDRQQTVEDLPRRIVENLVAVVVAAFDAESFLIWVED